MSIHLAKILEILGRRRSLCWGLSRAPAALKQRISTGNVWIAPVTLATLIFTGTRGTSKYSHPVFHLAKLLASKTARWVLSVYNYYSYYYYSYYYYYFKGEKSLHLSRLVAVKWGAVDSTYAIPSVFSWLVYVLNSFMGRGFNDSCQRSFNCMMLMEAGKWAAVTSTIVLGERGLKAHRQCLP